MFDTHEVKDPNDTSKWYEYCAMLRDTAGRLTARRPREGSGQGEGRADSA